MDLIPRFFTNDLYDDFFERRPRKREHMQCDIYEEDGKCIIEMDLPGVKKEDLNIDIDEGYLTISVVKSSNTDDENKNYIRKERYFGKYERKFYVGDIDEKEIKASFKDGVLNVSMPTTKKELGKKSIEIE